GISGLLMLHMRERNYQRRQSLNDTWIFDHGRHRDVRHLKSLNTGNTLNALQHSLEGGNVCFEICFLLVEEHVLGREHDFRRAFASIYACAFQDVFERERATDLCCRAAELTTAAATSGDLNHAKCRAMLHDGNLFNRRLHFLGHLDDPLECWITGHHSFEEIAEHTFDLAVDQIIDVELIKAISAFQLPGARPADDDLWPVLLNNRVLDDLEKLSRVDGNQVLAGNL